jgi:hypothetical protein
MVHGRWSLDYINPHKPICWEYQEMVQLIQLLSWETVTTE